MKGTILRQSGRITGVAMMALLAGCGWFGGSKDDIYVEQPVEVLYNRALDDLGAQDYKNAAKEFEEVDRQHPYSVWATKAQIMVAFTYYQSNKYDDAIIALDRFIQLHPGHRDIPYAYYLKQQLYAGAIGRYRVVIERYQTTSQVPEALERLVECYLALGVKQEAQETAAVLGHNFPGSDWYQDAYYLVTGEGSRPDDEKGGGWFFGLF